MKKYPILFIYSFLYVSCASFSQLYAMRSTPFVKKIEKDAEKCDFLKKALDLVDGTHFKWRALKNSDSFVTLTGPTFKEAAKKDAYKQCLENALRTAEMSSELKIKAFGAVHLVHQGEGLSYYVGERKNTINLIVKVSEAEYKQFFVQKQAKHIQLDSESIQTLLKQEFQVKTLLEPGVEQEETLGTKLQKAKEILFSNGKMLSVAFPCRKPGEFSVVLASYYSNRYDYLNYVETLNKMFEEIQGREKGSWPFEIGKTKTFTYYLRKKKSCECESVYCI
jgi:hypothetical protein